MQPARASALWSGRVHRRSALATIPPSNPDEIVPTPAPEQPPVEPPQTDPAPDLPESEPTPPDIDEPGRGPDEFPVEDPAEQRG